MISVFSNNSTIHTWHKQHIFTLKICDKMFFSLCDRDHHLSKIRDSALHLFYVVDTNSKLLIFPCWFGKFRIFCCVEPTSTGQQVSHQALHSPITSYHQINKCSVLQPSHVGFQMTRKGWILLIVQVWQRRRLDGLYCFCWHCSRVMSVTQHRLFQIS